VRSSALRETAVQQVVKGTATIETKGGQKVIKVGDGQYVQYAVDREESIFTILSDFGTGVKSATTGGAAGPLNNQIPQPDRVWDGNATDDNSTNWSPNFNKSHYQDLMFGAGESFQDFFLKQSNGRFMAKGDVSDWVTVPYNEASYGSNAISDEPAPGRSSRTVPQPGSTPRSRPARPRRRSRPTSRSSTRPTATTTTTTASSTSRTATSTTSRRFTPARAKRLAAARRARMPSGPTAGTPTPTAPVSQARRHPRRRSPARQHRYVDR